MCSPSRAVVDPPLTSSLLVEPVTVPRRWADTLLPDLGMPQHVCYQYREGFDEPGQEGNGELCALFEFGLSWDCLLLPCRELDPTEISRH